jgi:hypothetical protein
MEILVNRDGYRIISLENGNVRAVLGNGLLGKEFKPGSKADALIALATESSTLQDNEFEDRLCAILK